MEHGHEYIIYVTVMLSEIVYEEDGSYYDAEIYRVKRATGETELYGTEIMRLMPDQRITTSLAQEALENSCGLCQIDLKNNFRHTRECYVNQNCERN